MEIKDSLLESNFLKIPVYCESTKHYCRLHAVYDTMHCTQSVHSFQGQSAGYDNGCFSAVNSGFFFFIRPLFF